MFLECLMGNQFTGLPQNLTQGLRPVEQCQRAPSLSRHSAHKQMSQKIQARVLFPTQEMTASVLIVNKE